MIRKALGLAIVLAVFIAVPISSAQNQEPGQGATTIPEARPGDSSLFFVVGHPDTSTWASARGPMPLMCLDRDGCTITIICQSETSKRDEVRMNVYPFGFEYVNDDYGKRGRREGIFGSTRTGENGFTLGDTEKDVLFAFKPKDSDFWWASLADYDMKGGGSLLGEDNVIFYSHPKYTTRVIIED